MSFRPSDSHDALDRDRSSVEAALEDLAAGRFVIVLRPDREAQGALTIAAEFATPEAITFMAIHARGLIRLDLTGPACEQLDLGPMTRHTRSGDETPFRISVEARDGVSTGISAHDRAQTIKVAIDPGSGPRDLVRPGHLFPVKARPGGLLERMDQAEASVDLARLAGLTPAGVSCEIMNDDGTVAQLADLLPYARRHGLTMISMADIADYRLRHEMLVTEVGRTRLTAPHDDFVAVKFHESIGDRHHVALVKGDVADRRDVLVRVQPECPADDLFHLLRCDCGAKLDQALDRLGAADHGALLSVAGDRRRPGAAGESRERSIAPRARDYVIGFQMLASLEVRTVRMLGDEMPPVTGSEAFGLGVTGLVPMSAGGRVELGGDRRHAAAG